MANTTVGYWKIRGLGASIRYLLTYCGVAYEDVMYEQGDGPEFSREPWMSVKFTLGLDFPNLPYLFDGNMKMTETIPIHKYIADQYKPELLGSDPATRAKVNMLSGVVGDLKMAATMPCYMTGNREDIIKAANDKLPPIVSFMGNNKFLAGDSITYLDFYFWELLELLNFVSEGKILDDFPTLKAYHANFECIESLKAVIAQQRELPFNNKSAKLNNK